MRAAHVEPPSLRCGQLHDPRLAAGRLSQTCPRCGRSEAAHWYCSWCVRPMTPANWYEDKRGSDEAARRMPKTAPADPPTELREHWPPSWGPKPRQKAASAPQEAADTPEPLNVAQNTTAAA